jgi:hypothetical protein
VKTVGKKIGGAHYVHRSAEDVLSDQEGLRAARALLPRGFRYDVVKHDPRAGRFSFISSPDWDDADEPTVGDSYIVDPEAGTVKLRRGLSDPEVYHHKWMFVKPDYKGFDVKKSKERSKWWTSKSGINKSKIGKKSYWGSVLKNIGEGGGMNMDLRKYLDERVDERIDQRIFDEFFDRAVAVLRKNAKKNRADVEAVMKGFCKAKKVDFEEFSDSFWEFFMFKLEKKRVEALDLIVSE